MSKKTLSRSVSVPMRIEDAIQTIRQEEGRKYSQVVTILLAEALKQRGIRF